MRKILGFREAPVEVQERTCQSCALLSFSAGVCVCRYLYVGVYGILYTCVHVCVGMCVHMLRVHVCICVLVCVYVHPFLMVLDCFSFISCTQLLNVLEDFLVCKGYMYCRLDGSSCKARDTLKAFNSDLDQFAILISRK